jgi:hypothetical protein
MDGHIGFRYTENDRIGGSTCPCRTLSLCPFPKQVVSLLNLLDLYKGEFWFRKQHTFSLLTVVTIRMSMTPDPSVVGGRWQ